MNILAKTIHEGNIKNGFWEESIQILDSLKDTDKYQYYLNEVIAKNLMLITSELAEALEAVRKGVYAGKEAYLNSDKYSNEYFDRDLFKSFIKDSFEDEIADAFIRLLDLAAFVGMDLEWHVQEKLQYNRTRGYKHGKKL